MIVAALSLSLAAEPASTVDPAPVAGARQGSLLGSLAGHTELTWARAQHVSQADSYRASAVLANVVGEFVVVDVVPSGEAMVDWVLALVGTPMENEWETSAFILESLRPGYDVAPRIDVGDHVFLAAQVKTDGRLVQDCRSIIVKKPDGRVMTGDGRLVVGFTGSGEVRSTQVIGARASSMTGEWEVIPALRESRLDVPWEAVQDNARVVLESVAALR